MSTSCPPAPTNKKEYISDIAKILVKDFGKKKYYKPEEVKKAYKKSKWYQDLDLNNDDFSCWAMCTFSSHSDFDNYHENSGETCDYVSMKSEMINGLGASTSDDWTSIADIDTNTSWLDFDSIINGIGDFFSGIDDID